MKVTKQQLQEIIKEELAATLAEYGNVRAVPRKKRSMRDLGKDLQERCPLDDEEALEEETIDEEKPSAGLTKKQKSAVVKKARAGKDIGKKGKGFEKVVQQAKKSGAKDPEAVAAAAMWKGIKR